MHFSVSVLVDVKNGKRLEELLAPYQENNMGDCPRKYLEFNECSIEEIEEYEKHKYDYKNLDKFMYEYYGYKKDDKTGKYGYWENPNAKWDGYVIGGRWSNSLLTKSGVRCNSAKLKDIDWVKLTQIKKKEAEELWDNTVNNPNSFSHWITINNTRENYIESESQFSTYAVITPDGEWHSKDGVGLFGVSSDNAEDSESWSKGFYDTFIKNMDDELMLVIVDCHV